jgi:hypothetical protein
MATSEDTYAQKGQVRQHLGGTLASPAPINNQGVVPSQYQDQTKLRSETVTPNGEATPTQGERD